MTRLGNATAIRIRITQATASPLPDDAHVDGDTDYEDDGDDRWEDDEDDWDDDDDDGDRDDDD
ncbi:MAG: hypothetical protein ACLUHL_13390 [Dysosmobacter welbionis]